MTDVRFDRKDNTFRINVAGLDADTIRALCSQLKSPDLPYVHGVKHEGLAITAQLSNPSLFTEALKALKELCSSPTGRRRKQQAEPQQSPKRGRRSKGQRHRHIGQRNNRS